jgi:hypothetical protein
VRQHTLDAGVYLVLDAFALGLQVTEFHGGGFPAA